MADMTSSGPGTAGAAGGGDNVETHTLAPEEELRIEIPHPPSTSTPSATGQCTVRLTDGSAEIFGVELAQNKPYSFSGCKLAIFTWHGCTLEVGGRYDVLYTSTETACNVAYVNTHAQLEVLRDEAIQSAQRRLNAASAAAPGQPPRPPPSSSSDKAKNGKSVDGPRVLICGPPDSGKTSLSVLLAAYAAKLSRTPVLVDLDVGGSPSVLSVPGTIAAAPVHVEALDAQQQPHGIDVSKTSPLVYWYGFTDASANPELYRRLLGRLADAVNDRLKGDADGNASGVIVNSMGSMIEPGPAGMDLLLEALDRFRINVVLVMGHDRLYSILKTHFARKEKEMERHDDGGGGGTGTDAATIIPKIVKLPRSGGIVSRDANFRRASRSNSIRRYFHGDVVPFQPSSMASQSTQQQQQQQQQGQGTQFVHRYTPALVEKDFDDLRLYKTSQVSLSKGMLPVAGTQQSEKIQLTELTGEGGGGFQISMTHGLVAVCHPSAVERFDDSSKGGGGGDDAEQHDDLYGDSGVGGGAFDDARSQREEELYLSSVAGFVVVEKVDSERDRVSMLSPCSGDLPSNTLLMGDITWME